MTPLKLTAVITKDVGSPRNDGTAGSGLYPVPVGLNRKPDQVERDLLASNWNRPPTFTSMHRPGILRVHTDRVILDGTTIEEVERYHAATLALVVEKTNTDAAAIRARKNADAARQAQVDQDHSDHVDDVAGRISF